MKLTLRLKGGTGSGHFGHSGRPGKVGGSGPGGGRTNNLTVSAVDEVLGGKGIESSTWDVSGQAWVSPSGNVYEVDDHVDSAFYSFIDLGYLQEQPMTADLRKTVNNTMRNLGYARVRVHKFESDFDVQVPMKRGTRQALTEIVNLQAVKNLVWTAHNNEGLIDAGKGVASFNRVNM